MQSTMERILQQFVECARVLSKRWTGGEFAVEVYMYITPGSISDSAGTTVDWVTSDQRSKEKLTSVKFH